MGQGEEIEDRREETGARRKEIEGRRGETGARREETGCDYAQGALLMCSLTVILIMLWKALRLSK